VILEGNNFSERSFNCWRMSGETNIESKEIRYSSSLTETKENKNVPVSILCFETNVSRFTAIFSWSGMMFCCLLMMISFLAFWLIPSDIKICIGYLTYVNPYLRISFDSISELILICLKAFGGVTMMISFTFFLLYFHLSKRNSERDHKGVKKMLKIICYVTGSLTIWFSLLTLAIMILFCIHGAHLGPRINLKPIFHYHFEIFLPILISFTTVIMFNSLKVNDIGTQESLEAFLLFKHFVIILFTILVTITSLCLIITVNQLWIFLFGVWSIFLWIFYTGFCVTIYTIMINAINCSINEDDSVIFTILNNDLVQLPSRIMKNDSKMNENHNSAIFTIMKKIMIPLPILKTTSENSKNMKGYINSNIILTIKKNILLILSKPIPEDNEEYVFFKRILFVFIGLNISCILTSIMFCL